MSVMWPQQQSCYMLHGQEEVLYGDAGYQGLENREEMAGKQVECRIAMRPGKRRQLPDTPEGHLQEFCEQAKAHIRAKVEHVFRVLKQQLGFSKTRLRGLKKNCSRLWGTSKNASPQESEARFTRKGAGSSARGTLVCPVMSR